MILGFKGPNNSTINGAHRSYRFFIKGNDVYPTCMVENEKDARRVLKKDERVFIVKNTFKELAKEYKHSLYGKDDTAGEAVTDASF